MLYLLLKNGKLINEVISIKFISFLGSSKEQIPDTMKPTQRFKFYLQVTLLSEVERPSYMIFPMLILLKKEND